MKKLFVGNLPYAANEQDLQNFFAENGVTVDIVTVIQSLIVLFIAAPPLVRTIFRLRGQRAGADAATLQAVGG